MPECPETQSKLDKEANHEISQSKNRDLDPNPLKDDLKLLERKRISQILKAVDDAKLDHGFARTLIDEGVSINQAREKIIDAWAAQGVRETPLTHHLTAGDLDESKTRRQGVEQALLNRFHPSNYTMTEQARPYANFSLLELARIFVDATGIDTRGLSRLSLAERALHSTSDFPLILANVANKTLRSSYEQAPQTFKPFVRITSVNDFKLITRVQLGDGVKLDPVNEHGEFSYGTLGEAQERYQVATYGKIIGITRQTLVNDDLDAFTRIPQLFGRAAANLESDLVYQILIQNLAMHDGKPLFSKSHHNLDDKGMGLSIDALAEARKVMRLQTGLNKAKLNLYPKYLVPERK